MLQFLTGIILYKYSNVDIGNITFGKTIVRKI